MLRNAYADVILESSLHANEGHIIFNESILTIMKQIWTQMYNEWLFSVNEQQKMIDMSSANQNEVLFSAT